VAHDVVVGHLAELLQEVDRRVAGAGVIAEQDRVARQRGIQQLGLLRLLHQAFQLAVQLCHAQHVLHIPHQHIAHVRAGRRQEGQAAAQAHPQRPFQQGRQLLRRIQRRIERGHLFDRTIQQPDQGLAHQLFLRLEVLVQAGLGDAHGASHVIHRHQVEALAAKDHSGGVQDGVLAQLESLVFEAEFGKNTHW